MTQVFYPALTYRDPAAALEWLARVFGCREIVAYKGDDGRIMHAEMALGPAVFMFGPPNPQRGWVSPLDTPVVTQTVYAYLADPDAHYARAKAAGAEILFEIRYTEYGSREYSAKDLEGHVWSFGTYRAVAPE